MKNDVLECCSFGASAVNDFAADALVSCVFAVRVDAASAAAVVCGYHDLKSDEGLTKNPICLICRLVGH